MASLSLNTSITSSHKSDFYTGVYVDANNTTWMTIYNLYGSYFTDINTEVPCEDMVIYARTNISQNWKELGRYNMCGYYGYCYMYFTRKNGFYYNFNNTSDPENYQPYDKIRVNYGEMSAESFVNRTNLNIKTVDINNSIVPNSNITLSCHSICESYSWSPFSWSNINTISDNNGNSTISFFNTPGGPYYPTTYRTYRINATKNSLSGYKDEIILNQQDYPSSGSVNVQLICSEPPQCTLNITD